MAGAVEAMKIVYKKVFFSQSRSIRENKEIKSTRISKKWLRRIPTVPSGSTLLLHGPLKHQFGRSVELPNCRIAELNLKMDFSMQRITILLLQMYGG